MSILLSTRPAASRAAVTAASTARTPEPPAYTFLRGGATTPDVDALADRRGGIADRAPHARAERRDEYRAQLSSIAEEAVADFAADDGAERARLERRIQNELDAAAARYREHAQRAVDAVAARLGAALGELRHEALLERWRVRVLQLGRVRAEFERSLDLAAAEARAAVAKLAAHYYSDAKAPSAQTRRSTTACSPRGTSNSCPCAWAARSTRIHAQRAVQLARVSGSSSRSATRLRWSHRVVHVWRRSDQHRSP